jgi:hypothetical protein
VATGQSNLLESYAENCNTRTKVVRDGDSNLNFSCGSDSSEIQQEREDCPTGVTSWVAECNVPSQLKNTETASPVESLDSLRESLSDLEQDIAEEHGRVNSQFVLQSCLLRSHFSDYTFELSGTYKTFDTFQLFWREGIARFVEEDPNRRNLYNTEFSCAMESMLIQFFTPALASSFKAFAMENFNIKLEKWSKKLQHLTERHILMSQKLAAFREAGKATEAPVAAANNCVHQISLCLVYNSVEQEEKNKLSLWTLLMPLISAMFKGTKVYPTSTKKLNKPILLLRFKNIGQKARALKIFFSEEQQNSFKWLGAILKCVNLSSEAHRNIV